MLQRSMEKKRAGEGGFTLVELLVVIVILGILAAIVVFAVGGITDKGETSACKATSRVSRRPKRRTTPDQTADATRTRPSSWPASTSTRSRRCTTSPITARATRSARPCAGALYRSVARHVDNASAVWGPPRRARNRLGVCAIPHFVRVQRVVHALRRDRPDPCRRASESDHLEGLHPVLCRRHDDVAELVARPSRMMLRTA